MNDILESFSTTHERKYGKGQILIYQGENTPNMFFICEGYVKVYDISTQGAQKLLLLLGPGDMFPVLWAFPDGGRMHYFYETFTDAVVSVVPRKDVVEKIENDHEFTKILLKYFVNHAKELAARVDSIESTSAKHKVAQVLNYLSRYHGEKDKGSNYKVRMNVTHQSIADMAGITRETASTELKSLEKLKVFNAKDGNLLVNRKKLDEFLNS